MNELSDLVLLVLALFTSMTMLLYVLAIIDPQTNRPAQEQANAGHAPTSL